MSVLPGQPETADKAVEAADSARFFEHGKVVLEDMDPVGRTASIFVQLPNCLFQAVTPSLLGAGYLDNFRVAEPLSTWLPQVTEARLSFLGKQVDQAHVRINTAVAQQMDALLRTFASISQYLVNPADMVPMLPLGVYVSVRFRCRLDDVPKVLHGVQDTPVEGVHEFQWALACVLAQALREMEGWEAKRRLGPARGP